MKDKKILYSIIVATIFLLSIGLTYAYFSVTTSVAGDRNDIKASVGTLNILYTDGPEITATSIQPGWTATKTIKVNNTGSLRAYYSLVWASLTNEIINDELVLSVTCSSNSGTCNGIENTPVLDDEILIGVGIDPGEEQTYNITFEFKETSSAQNYNQDKKFNGKLNINEANEAYTLTGMLVDSDGNPIDNATIEVHSIVRTAITDMNGEYAIPGVEVGNHEINIKNASNTTIATDSIVLSSSSTETVSGKQITASASKGTIDLKIKLGASDINTISILEWYDKCSLNSNDIKCKLLSDNTEYADNVSSTFVSSASGINFGAISSDTNGKGLYYTTNSSKTEEGKKVYYYRGAVTNNYLIFGGYCWRIIRTVEDGSVRLRYGGVPTSGSCPQTGTNVSIISALFSKAYNDSTYVGYMTGNKSAFPDKVWPQRTRDMSTFRYYYSPTYSINASGNYYLTGTITSGIWEESQVCTASSCPVLGYYTCLTIGTNGTCAVLYKVSGYISSTSAYLSAVMPNSSSYAQAHQNVNDSTIKKVIDAWYSGGVTSNSECYNSGYVNCNFTSLSSKLIDNSSLIANTPYCNDRTIGTGGTVATNTYTELGYGGANSLYGAARRNFTGGSSGTTFSGANASPSYICPQNNDKFTLSSSFGGINGYGNNALKYPIGLLTADEAVFAGKPYGLGVTSNFLTASATYWTMTPSHNLIQSGGAIDSYEATISSSLSTYQNSSALSGVVPAISLKSSATISSGTGAYNSPYIIN